MYVITRRDVELALLIEEAIAAVMPPSLTIIPSFHVGRCVCMYVLARIDVELALSIEQTIALAMPHH